jgi:hypothetical protein
LETSCQIVAEDLGNRSNDRELQAFRHRGGFGGKQALVPQGVRAPFCVWPIPAGVPPTALLLFQSTVTIFVSVQMGIFLLIGVPSGNGQERYSQI